jgi:hypothetical protein
MWIRDSAAQVQKSFVFGDCHALSRLVTSYHILSAASLHPLVQGAASHCPCHPRTHRATGSLALECMSFLSRLVTPCHQGLLLGLCTLCQRVSVSDNPIITLACLLPQRLSPHLLGCTASTHTISSPHVKKPWADTTTSQPTITSLIPGQLFGWICCHFPRCLDLYPVTLRSFCHSSVY